MKEYSSIKFVGEGVGRRKTESSYKERYAFDPEIIRYYIITQVILAFSLVLAYDLLEGRRTIDVIVTKIFPPCFKMAESFENLDNILRDWAKDKVQKSLAEALNRF